MSECQCPAAKPAPKSRTKRVAKKAKEGFLVISLRLFFFLLDRLNEASTLRGVMMGIGGLAGWMRPDKIDLIFPVTALAVAAIGAILPDSWRKKAEKPKADAQAAK